MLCCSFVVVVGIRREIRGRRTGTHATMIETFDSILRVVIDSYLSRVSLRRREKRISKDLSYIPHILASITPSVVRQ